MRFAGGNIRAHRLSRAGKRQRSGHGSSYIERRKSEINIVGEKLERHGVCMNLFGPARPSGLRADNVFVTIVVSETMERAWLENCWP